MGSAEVLVHSAVRGDVLVLSLTGIVDAYNASSLSRQLERALATASNKVVLNCSGVNYMSSVGVGTILTLHKQVVRSGGSLFVSGMRQAVYEVFSLLGFTSILNFSDADETAIGLMSKPAPVFPAVVKCVICSRKLRAVHAGSFRCPSCSTVLVISSNAQVHLR